MDKNTKNVFDKLITKHGKRPKPDDLMQRKALNNVRAHYQSSLIKQKRKKLPLYALAATVLIMMSLGVLFNNNSNNSPKIFALDSYVKGDVQFSDDGKTWHNNKRLSLSSGLWIRTNTNSFINLTLNDTSQLRVNQNSLIEVVTASEVRLIDGGLYHDADNIQRANPLLIRTSLGDVQHIGTRYLVEKSTNNLQVAVRNGLVEINNTVKRQIQAGKQLTININGQQNQTSISAYAPFWDWTNSAGKPFETKGKNLKDFIAWYAHENGYKVNWNNLQSKTKQVQLTGNISQLDKQQQIKTVFLSTKFDYEINQGILSIL